MMKKKLYVVLVLFLCMFMVMPILGKGRMFKNAKKIEKTLKEISPKLFAAETEVSNIQYQEFLSDLLSKNRIDDYKKCLPDSTAWEILSDTISACFEYFYNYHSSKSYQFYPVVNISYESASMFCKWLTDKYNASSKKKFKKVEIKLPDEMQWLKAAGDSKAMYAWGDEWLYETVKKEIVTGFNSRSTITYTILGHTKNQARARLHFIDLSNPFIRDFPAISAPVKSFIKYKNGLYNIHGNVSEMLDTKGKAKGGSWYDIPENAVLSQTQIFDGPDPRIGFRYFMVVIEE